jgi:dTDP-L-rhamnose 4-epimerase
MKILVTGGCGFIGQYVARRLVADGHEVVALDSLLPQVHLDPGASRDAFPGVVVEGDVSDAATWDGLDTDVDGVVHLAAETGTGQSMYEGERYHRVNVDGTRLAGAYADRLGVPIVALSSRAVYGDGTLDHASHEDDPHRWVSVYGETKSLGEAELLSLDVPVTIIRPQNVVGPGQALHNPYTGVLAAFVARLREDKSLVVYGDGTQTRDFMHVDDLAALVVWSLLHPPTDGPRILNAGTGTRTTLLELAAYAAEGSPREDVPVEHLAVTRAGDIEHACADLTRLREAGAPEPAWTSHDAIVAFVRWGWDRPGADSQAWDQALEELSARGLTEGAEDAS